MDTFTDNAKFAYPIASLLLQNSEGYELVSTAQPRDDNDKRVLTATGCFRAHPMAVVAFNFVTADVPGAEFVFPDWLTFQSLLAKWKEERGLTSSITAMALCRSYQRIIAMGEKAIPLILRQMELEGDEPDMWFWALQVLTNADPVPQDAQGDMAQMAHAWLHWARGRYVW